MTVAAMGIPRTMANRGMANVETIGMQGYQLSTGEEGTARGG